MTSARDNPLGLPGFGGDGAQPGVAEPVLPPARRCLPAEPSLEVECLHSVH